MTHGRPGNEPQDHLFETFDAWEDNEDDDLPGRGSNYHKEQQKSGKQVKIKITSIVILAMLIAAIDALASNLLDASSSSGGLTGMHIDDVNDSISTISTLSSKSESLNASSFTGRDNEIVIHHDSNDETNDINIEGNICTNIDDMNDGNWYDNAWVPKSCRLRIFEPVMISKCLKHNEVAFCGDSLLRNIALKIGKRIDPMIKFENTWGDQSFPLIGLHTCWTPSVFHQQCKSTSGSTIIISEAVWNMGRGEYFKGGDAYEASLRSVLSRFKGKRVIFFGLHKLHRERPACRKSPKCYESNSAEKEIKFREIGLKVAQESGVELFDACGVTNTLYAEIDGDDAVHYGSNTTSVEANVLLNLLCASTLDLTHKV